MEHETKPGPYCKAEMMRTIDGMGYGWHCTKCKHTINSENPDDGCLGWYCLCSRCSKLREAKHASTDETN